MDTFWMEVLGASDPKVKLKWAARGQNIEQTVRKAVIQNGETHEDDWDPVARALGEIPFRCLEIGTYCGYSALRIARNRECAAAFLSLTFAYAEPRASTDSVHHCLLMVPVPDNGSLLSVEKDPLFAAIATKIVEYAGLVR